MSQRLSNPKPRDEEPRINLWRLPRVVSVAARQVTYAEPRIYYVGRERRETRQAVELQVETSGPIPVRALTPILVVGETAIADYSTEGQSTYRFVGYEPERLKPGAPIRWGWPGPREALSATPFRFSLGAARGSVASAATGRLGPKTFEGLGETETPTGVIPPPIPNPTPRGGLVLVPHWIIRRTCNDGKGFTSIMPATNMTPSVMNPGFLKADGALDTDPVLQAKLSKLLQDDPEYKLEDAAQRPEKIRVALVDLTGEKICKPRFAGYRSTVPIYSASTIKYAILYAVYQLIFDLNEMVTTGHITTVSGLIRAANTTWSKLKCKPDLNWLVTFDETAKIVLATENLKQNFERMVQGMGWDMSASELILRIGFEYIASVVWNSGLYHPERKGLWIGNTFAAAPPPANLNPACHKQNEKGVTFWAKNPFGYNSQTALSAVTFFTLLAQRRLVNERASEDMEALLKQACSMFSPPPGVIVRATKCGLLEFNTRHFMALMEGPGRCYAFAILTTDPYFKPPPLVKKPVQWSAHNKLIADLDKLIQENNP
jgi:hypothetical protein